MNALLSRYQEALGHLPPPGGNGCHAKLLGAANLGVLAGRSDHELLHEIRMAIPPGGRHVGDREITDAIRRARQDHSRPGTAQAWTAGATRGRPSQPAFDGEEVRRRIIERAGAVDVMDVLDHSAGDGHLSLLDPPQRDAVLLLETLYSPDEYIFIGRQYDAGRDSVRTVGAWIEHFRGVTDAVEAGRRWPLIAPNPLSGDQHLTKDGKPSFRADACVAALRFCLAEFDAIPKGGQLSFWRGIRLPLVALIDTGGKSYHAWIRVDCRDAREWDEKVRGELYGRFFEPLGLDGACKNPGRLSRLPGVVREGKNAFQQLVYVNPIGGTI